MFICGTMPQSGCKVTDYLPISQIFRNISAFCPAYSALSCASVCYARRFACINVKRQRALLAEFLLPFVVTSLLATRCSLLCPEGLPTTFRGARQILSTSCGHVRGEKPIRDDHSL